MDRQAFFFTLNSLLKHDMNEKFRKKFQMFLLIAYKTIAMQILRIALLLSNETQGKRKKYSPAIKGENRLFTFYTPTDISIPKK